MDIIRSTKDFVVMIKPFGTESEHEAAALLAAQLGGSEDEYYCVHRLDQAAGGLLVYARNKQAAAALTAQLSSQTLQKRYYAVISGIPDNASGTMHDLLFHDKARKKSFPVRRNRKGVKEAALDYRVLKTYMPEPQLRASMLSLVEIRLHTGRFHQIRVQFASRGMPLAGDRKYGSRISCRNIALFCCHLRFLDPVSGEEIICDALPPAVYPWNCFC